MFLDRDGTLIKSFLQNGSPIPPSSISEVETLPGAQEALRIFRRANYIPVVITNQPDVVRGTNNLEEVVAINNLVLKMFDLKHIYTCFHDDEQECDCRKPKPGLLLKAAKDLEINLTTSLMIGDRWRDIYAGQAAGCECYFIDYQYTEREPVAPYTRVKSLLDVALMIVEPK